MNTLRSLSILAALGLAGAAYAQTQSPPDQSGTMPPSSSSSQESQDTSPSSSTSPGSSSSSQSGSESSQSSSGSSTQQSEPGATDPGAASSPHQRQRTHEDYPEAPTTADSPSGGQGYEQSSDPSAASSSHQQQATRTAAAGAKGKMVGMQVVSPAGDQLGSVTDVVSDTGGTPSYIVISAAGETTAVPYSAVAPMVQNDKIVMEETRLHGAPKVSQSDLNDQSGNAMWQSEADRYWNRGSSMRSASPGDTSDPDQNPSSSQESGSMERDRG